MSTTAIRSVALGPLPIVGLANSKTPTVLAMHGWQRRASDFEFLLQSDIPTVALDLPGFGDTELPSSEWGSPEYAEAVAAALDDRGWSNLVVVGHSFGGRVGVHLAQQRPDLVAGAVFTGAPLIRPNQGPGKSPAMMYRLARRLNKLGVLPDAVMEKQRHKYGSADYRQAGPVLRPVLVRAINENYDEQIRHLGESKKPTALVWGQHDTAAPTTQVARLTEILDPVQVTIGADKGHDTVRDMRAALLDAIRAVLSSAGSR